MEIGGVRRPAHLHLLTDFGPLYTVHFAYFQQLLILEMPWIKYLPAIFFDRFLFGIQL